MRAPMLVGALVCGVASLAATARDSRACGGCFIRPSSQVGTVVTDHRMIFTVSPTQTTLYDQIQYSGSPSDFAWVLPIHGQVGLGVSSDLLFSVLDQQTQITILAPPYPCAPCNCGPLSAGSFGASGGSSSGGGPKDGITVTAQQVVGPYATVQLHPNSTSDTAALTAWLQANSYSVPPSVDPIIAAYVQEGFDFLAIKLVPGLDVQAMRPISVTSTGAGLSLPLRMVAAGTGATVGITLQRSLRAPELRFIHHRSDELGLGLVRQQQQLLGPSSSKRTATRQRGLADRDLARPFSVRHREQRSAGPHRVGLRRSSGARRRRRPNGPRGALARPQHAISPRWHQHSHHTNARRSLADRACDGLGARSVGRSGDPFQHLPDHEVG